MLHTIVSLGAEQFAGLAAPQVGYNTRVFFALGKLFINPQVKTSKQMERYDEGCFSVKATSEGYRVWRPKSVWVKYQDLKGNWLEERYNGYMAQVILHEYDHLEGLTIKDIGTKI